VARSVVVAGLRLASAGIVLGLVGAWWLRRFTGSLLYGVEPGDPLPLAGAALCLLAVTVLAALSPARRATRIDPMSAIRAE
jgi:ABC-type antimicrobial peptide transport system permease subunit